VITVSRDQVINRLREADYYFKKRGKHTEIWRQKATGRRVAVPLRNDLTLTMVKTIFSGSGLTFREVEAFLQVCTKGSA